MNELPTEQLERAEGRNDGRYSGSAFQIIQTLMLLAIISIGGWIGATTVESSKAISRMEETVRGISHDNQQLVTQIQRLTDEHYALDRRVTTIEARSKP